VIWGNSTRGVVFSGKCVLGEMVYGQMFIRGNVPNPPNYHDVLQSTLLEKLDLINPCSYRLRRKAKLKNLWENLFYFSIRGNVTRGSVSRGNVIRKNIIRGNVFSGKCLFGKMCIQRYGPRGVEIRRNGPREKGHSGKRT
jgi:hypothetical protein